MDEDLRRFVAEHAPHAEEDVRWTHADGSPMPLHVTCYVGAFGPPENLVTSVRAVVTEGGKVLTLRNPGGVHALPGGRRRAGETVEETLRREVMEESGYLIETPRPLGAVHLCHLAPKPSGYPYPYPDFLWLVFTAESAGLQDASARVRDDYELEAVFEPPDVSVRRLDLASRVFIRAAFDAAV
jgi:ADP-ribose pyrophosphatase YjhB (NUDIX family)